MAFPDNFEKTLNDFFHRYHPRKKEKVPALVKEFAGHEKEVMLLLCKKYQVDPNSIDGLMAYTPTAQAPAAIPEKQAEAPTSEEKEENSTDVEEVAEEDSEKKED